MTALTRLVDLLYLPTLLVGTLFLCSQVEALCRAWVAYRRNHENQR